MNMAVDRIEVRTRTADRIGGETSKVGIKDSKGDTKASQEVIRASQEVNKTIMMRMMLRINKP